MRNLDKIRIMPVEDLAELLVQSKYTYDDDDWDYGDDGSIVYVDVEDYYTDPSGGWHYDFEDAVEATIDWLNSSSEVTL